MPPQLAEPRATDATDAPAADLGNRYAQQLAAQRRRLDETRAGEVEQLVRHEAVTAAFASLQLHRTAPPSEQSMRLLATAATRRLARWQDPATGGFEASDRETLMRQAAEMGLSPEVADKILAGVIEAFQNRPTPVPLAAEARATSRRRRWPRGLPIWLLAITALLLAIQVGVVVLWLRLFV